MLPASCLASCVNTHIKVASRARERGASEVGEAVHDPTTAWLLTDGLIIGMQENGAVMQFSMKLS